MNIIYLSSSLGTDRFSRLLESGEIKSVPQAQKYHSLLLSGIAENVKVTAVSAIPANRQWTKQTKFKRETEWEGRVKYIYSAFVNFPFVRQYTLYRNAKREIKRLYKRHKDSVIVTDILNQAMSMAGRKCAKKYGIPVIGIVTDVPGMTSGAVRDEKKSLKTRVLELADKIGRDDLDKYDGYLFLAEAMSELVSDKPYVVIEGHADKNMRNRENDLLKKDNPKTVMYAGGLHKEYGIKMLVDAFLKGGFDGYKLCIYGDGNYADELLKISEEKENVEFFGLRPNDEIVEKQLTATLLVNPRPTDMEFVKYSFPSKTMECMASGTPLLTTRLPSMPKEYFEHVRFIDEETEDGILKALDETLKMSDEELFNLGKAAKEFVIENKTNDVQAKKFIEFIENNF
ncbi:MAG: glycosyltransferase [Clostridia bacterium]|nr:glycosyltransferase [Clostridia bacterium]